ncbi:hypothetical protein H5410_048072 [Solanum commersonii]|uniref:F-box associated beta-propeller type 3 domain-containing protein n=1 Tax=Solanum commersonii TaxID=4109 RepID=A0A9J5XKK8_SOLCO|nr:hypothetical protein H5410_048072 [Solanum commersonii]
MIRILKNFLFYQQYIEEDDFPIYSCSLSPVQLVEDTHKVNFPLNIEPRFCTIYNGCNGLFIIKVLENTVEPNILLLWNPSTRESMVLPIPEFSVGLTSCLGLGLNSSSGEYKILKIEGNEFDNHKVPDEIFTLKSGSWRKIGEHPRVTGNKVSEEICLLKTGNTGISILEGMLCAYSKTYDQGIRPFKVWVMRDYNLKES